MDDYLEILEWTLLAGHISPTAPDTLGMVRAGALLNGGGFARGSLPLIAIFPRLLPILQI